MKNIEDKILETLYKKGKAISKGNTFICMDYYLPDILGEIDLSEENTQPSLENLRDNRYIEWDRARIKITSLGLEYYQDHFVKRKIGFKNT